MTSTREWTMRWASNGTGLFVAAVSLMMSGCATTPVPTANAPAVPAYRVLNSSLLQRKDGYGQITVKRDEGHLASACNTRLFFNAAPVAEIAPGEKIVFYLPEGEQMIGAIALGICAGGLVEARVQISRAKPVIYRVSYGSSGEFSLQPTAF